MFIVLCAFTLFHLAAGAAGLGFAVRLLTPAEQAHWRSKRALLIAEILCWIYPLLALGAVFWAWTLYRAGDHLAAPIILAPFVWLIAMGLLFALVDFLEDGVLGNARGADRESQA